MIFTLKDGTILDRIPSFRIHCRQCGEEMPKSQIMQEKNWCSRKCRKRFEILSRVDFKKRKKLIQKWRENEQRM